MGIGGFIEPAIVLTLLFGGTWVNRERHLEELDRWSEKDEFDRGELSPSRLESSPLTRKSYDRNHSPVTSPTRRQFLDSDERWRKRDLRLFGLRRGVYSPNTRQFKHRLLSRLLIRFPFLVEVWYWALIYWVSAVNA